MGRVAQYPWDCIIGIRGERHVLTDNVSPPVPVDYAYVKIGADAGYILYAGCLRDSTDVVTHTWVLLMPLPKGW